MKLTRQKLRKIRSRCPRRAEEGIYLVEILVAVMIGAMLTFALLNAASLSMRHATASQNEVYANTIVSQVLEATRAIPYGELEANIGEHDLLTNKINSGETGPTIRPAPLQLNTVDKTWQNTSKSGRFRGDVKYSIEAGPELNTLKVKVSVSWRDSTRYASDRKVESSIVVAKNGAGEGV